MGMWVVRPAPPHCEEVPLARHLDKLFMSDPYESRCWPRGALLEPVDNCWTF
jgi:hypothetical protein